MALFHLICFKVLENCGFSQADEDKGFTIVRGHVVEEFILSARSQSNMKDFLDDSFTLTDQANALQLRNQSAPPEATAAVIVLLRAPYSLPSSERYVS